METRYPVHQDTVKHMSTDELRANFHAGGLFAPGELNLVYSHIDRVIIGGAVPINNPLKLEASAKDLGADFFLQRREVGIINIGGDGSVSVDGEKYNMTRRDGLYVGMGKQEVLFSSDDADNPARYYLFSAPAHTAYPTATVKIDEAEPVHLGDIEHSNTRTIYKYFHPDGVQSCQITMGMTLLAENNMWNTMPAHTHARRMEAYLYFDITGDNVVFHLMGDPNETRHLVMRNEEAVISPSWSIHAGMGTGNYSFIWGMAGENQAFSDMDMIPMESLR